MVQPTYELDRDRRSSQLPMKRTIAFLISALGAYVCLVLFSAPTAHTAPKRPGFVDVAPRSKISYKSNNSPGGHKYFPQPMCGGVAIFDYDNDGKMDIFFTNGAQLPEMKKTNPSYYNCLLKQRADGTFEDVTAQAGLRGRKPGLQLRRGRGRLRQRRLPGSVRLQRRPERPLPQQRQRDLHRCHRGLRHRRQAGRHAQRGGRLVRLRQRRPAGSDRG